MTSFNIYHSKSLKNQKWNDSLLEKSFQNTHFFEKGMILWVPGPAQPSQPYPLLSPSFMLPVL